MRSKLDVLIYPELITPYYLLSPMRPSYQTKVFNTLEELHGYMVYIGKVMKKELVGLEGLGFSFKLEMGETPPAGTIYKMIIQTEREKYVDDIFKLRRKLFLEFEYRINLNYPFVASHLSHGTNFVQFADRLVSFTIGCKESAFFDIYRTSFTSPTEEGVFYNLYYKVRKTEEGYELFIEAPFMPPFYYMDFEVVNLFDTNYI